MTGIILTYSQTVLVPSPHCRPLRAVMSKQHTTVRSVEDWGNRSTADCFDGFLCSKRLLVCSLELGQVQRTYW
jgi:hypothetical protein